MKWSILIFFILVVNVTNNTGQPKAVYYTTKIFKPANIVIKPLDSLSKKLNDLTYLLEHNF